MAYTEQDKAKRDAWEKIRRLSIDALNVYYNELLDNDGHKPTFLTMLTDLIATARAQAELWRDPNER